MSGYTQVQAQTMLDAAMDALTKAYANPQSYSVSSGAGSRSLNRLSITELQDAVTFWEQKVNSLSRGGIGIVGGIPVD